MASQNTLQYQTVWSECKSWFLNWKKMTPVHFKIEHLGSEVEQLIKQNTKSHKVDLNCKTMS